MLRRPPSTSKDEAGKTDRDRDIEHGANDERGDDADGQIPLRLAAFFGRGRYRIEADVREENNGPASQDAGHAVGHERMPVSGMNKVDGRGDEDEDGDELDADHHVVGRGRFANAADEDDSENQDHEKCRNVEAKVPTGMIEPVAGEVLQTFRQISR